MANSHNTHSTDHDRQINESRADYRREKAAALRDRLIFLLDDLAPSKGKYAYLQHRTGISAAAWQNLYLEKQMPTLEMILAISEYRREYLPWLITGEDTQAASAQKSWSAPSSDQWEKFQSHRAWLRTSRAKKTADDDH